MEAIPSSYQKLRMADCEGCLRPALDTLMEGCQFINFEWRYLYVNPAAAAHGRIDRGEMIGRSLFECIPGIERTDVFAALKRCMDTRQPVRVETDFMFPDGIASTFELSIRPIAEGICVMSNDITERKELERELLRVGDYEQARIGLDLHDGLCQRLVGIEFRQEALAQRLQKIDLTAGREAREIGAMLRAAVAETRSVARGLSPVVDGPAALEDALAELATATARNWGKDCSFNKNGETAPLDHLMATHLFRIAQEAVNNAVRHAGAKAILISLDASGESTLTLRVQDDGIGLAAKTASGMGQRSMRYRADLIGGRLTIRNCEVAGLEVVCTVQTRSLASGAAPSSSTITYDL